METRTAAAIQRAEKSAAGIPPLAEKGRQAMLVRDMIRPPKPPEPEPEPEQITIFGTTVPVSEIQQKKQKNQKKDVDNHHHQGL